MEVDRHKCVGTAMCVAIAAEHFRVEDGKARVLQPIIPAGDAEAIEAWESCPMAAVMIRDAAGEELDPTDA